MTFLMLLVVKWKQSSKKLQIEYSKHSQQKTKKLEKSIGIKDNNNDDDDAVTLSDSDSSEEGQVVKHIKNQQISTCT